MADGGREGEIVKGAEGRNIRPGFGLKLRPGLNPGTPKARVKTCHYLELTGEGADMRREFAWALGAVSILNPVQ